MMYEIRDNQMKAFLWSDTYIIILFLFYKTLNAYNYFLFQLDISLNLNNF